MLHCAAMFLAADLNASALADDGSLAMTGLPESEPDIMPALSGISPTNGTPNSSLILLAPPCPNT